jgi:hypothetical protein
VIVETSGIVGTRSGRGLVAVGQSWIAFGINNSSGKAHPCDFAADGVSLNRYSPVEPSRDLTPHKRRRTTTAPDTFATGSGTCSVYDDCSETHSPVQDGFSNMQTWNMQTWNMQT